MKQIFYLFLLAFFVVSCSDTINENQQPGGVVPATKTVSVRGAADAITSYGLYAYQKDELVNSKLGLSSSTEVAEISVPLDESTSVVAVGNGSALISGTEKYSTLKLRQDEALSTDFFVSPLSSFQSDGSEGVVAVNLKRVVGKVSFTHPLEADELAAITAFDEVKVTFRNVVTAYQPGVPAAEGNVLEEKTFTTDASKNFEVAPFTCFPNAGDAKLTFTLELYKGGQLVYTLIQPMPEAGFDVKASVESKVQFPLDELGYFEPTKSGYLPEVTITHVEF